MSKLRIFHKQIKILRSDGGGEYISKLFVDFMHEKNMIHPKTQPHTPHQNGVADRKNIIIIEKTRSLAIGCHHPKALWTEVVNTYIYLLNRSSTCANQGITPYKQFFECILSIDHLRIFGCLVYILVTINTRKK